MNYERLFGLAPRIPGRCRTGRRSAPVRPSL